MRLVREFERFLQTEVNLDKTRVETLTERVGAVKDFLVHSDWGEIIQRFSPQGSWAHKTIIKPPGDQGFDADLVVYVTPFSGWTPADYIINLREILKTSNIYKDITRERTRCVTLAFPGEFAIDLVPYVVNRPHGTYDYEVCNRKDDLYEPTDGELYTRWLDSRDALIGKNKLREVIRILKYSRDTKSTFSCKSILLNTLIGERIFSDDIFCRDKLFPDLPTSLRTLIGRLDNFLQDNPDMPTICNPVLPSEDFTRHWGQDEYDNFREVIERYHSWIDDAYKEVDDDESREKWRVVFGPEFGDSTKSAVSKDERYAEPPIKLNHLKFRDAIDQLRSAGNVFLSDIATRVPWMKPAPWPMRENQSVVIRATAHKDRTGKNPVGPLKSGEILSMGLELKFEAFTRTGAPYTAKEYEVKWQVTNTDRQAWREHALRGDFYSSKPRGVRWETTQYRGIHWVQAFVINKRKGACVAESERFFVAIE